MSSGVQEEEYGSVSPRRKPCQAAPKSPPKLCGCGGGQVPTKRHVGRVSPSTPSRRAARHAGFSTARRLRAEASMRIGTRIGVLLGGLSSERELSLRTGEAVHAALKARGHDAVRVFVDRDLDLALRAERIDVAFLALHGRYGEDGCVQGLLELRRIPYTRSDLVR